MSLLYPLKTYSYTQKRKFILNLEQRNQVRTQSYEYFITYILYMKNFG